MPTEILRPNASGDLNNVTGQNNCSVSPNHYTCCDETTEALADATGFHCSHIPVSDESDLFALPAPSGSGVISKVTLLYRAAVYGGGSFRGLIKTHSTIYETASHTDTSKTSYTEEYSTNPNTDEAWTWNEISDLQIGARLTSGPYQNTQCHWLYITVEYTPAVVKKGNFFQLF